MYNFLCYGHIEQEVDKNYTKGTTNYINNLGKRGGNTNENI